MPPTGAQTKVKEPEYCNWLRVCLALYYLKYGLHSFIQGEVDAMHKYILLKLCKGLTIPKPQCSSCKSKDLRQHRNTHVWNFLSSCPSSLCDVWLSELMTFHNKPTSNRIYWENCDVTAWPFRPWECAKLYMPRGQSPTNNGPANSDSQSLLTMMANCTYFHGKLSPTGLTLTHKVSKIRNTVMHSGDMRLSDCDRQSFIQDIIHLLEDPTHLISLKECNQAVDEINKINNVSVDVFFNLDRDMAALRECVNDCRQELGIHKKDELTIESLIEEVKQLNIQFAKATKDTAVLDAKYQELDSSVTTLKECVNDYRQELEVHKKDELTMESLKEEFTELKKETKAVLDAKYQELDSSVTTLRERVNDCRQELEIHKKDELTMESLKEEFTELKKETKAVLDAKYQELDSSVTTLKECVNDCRQELEIHKKDELTMESLKEEFTELKKETKAVLDAKYQELDSSVTTLKECVNDCRHELEIHKKDELTRESLKEEFTELNKETKAVLDAKYQELDSSVTTLKECVNDCRQELEIHKKDKLTMESLKEEFTELNKETKAVLDAKYQELDSSVTILKQQVSNLEKEGKVKANTSEATKPTEQVKMPESKADTNLGGHEKKLRKLDKEIQEVKAVISRATDQISAENIESGKEQDVPHLPEEDSIKTLGSSFEDVNQHADIRSRDLTTMKRELEHLQTRFQTAVQNTELIDRLSRIDELEDNEYQLEQLTRIEAKVTSIENQLINRTNLNRRIDLTRGRIERHKTDNTDVHVTTKAFDHARDILFEHKHLVVQGTPGEGKTYLALSLVAHLIEKDKELQPVQIDNANEWDEMVDTKRPLVVLLDDVLGKYELSETDLDRWKRISELIYPNLRSSSIFVIICIRTQIVLSIKASLQRNEALSFMFNSHVVDIGNEKHCLTKEERVQMLNKYAPKGLDRNDTVVFEDISEITNNVIGFPQNCRILRSRKHLMVDIKEVFSNNRFLVEEIQELSKKSPEIYTFLVLLMLSGGHLSFENKMEEKIQNTIKTISDYCGLEEKLTIGKIKAIGRELSGTFVEYKEETEKFNFQHDCIETAVFVSFVKDYLGLTLRMCSLKQLSKMCRVKTVFDRFDGENFLTFKVMIDEAHFQVVHERFKEGLESGERDSFKSIAEALVWKNVHFVDYFSKTITSVDDVLNFMSKRDSDGQSLLVHLIYAKSTGVVERIINNISLCCLRNHTIVERQLLLATTNACLAEEKDMLNNLIELREKVDDFVMLAAASTGNVQIMKGLPKGNINTVISIEDINDLANAIKNCISRPQNSSSYHHDINLFHIACRYGRSDMVKYLISSYPDLVHKTSSLGWTAAHFAAFSDKVELIQVLSAEQVDIETTNSDVETVLHIAAARSNKTMVNYLIKTWPKLIQRIDKNGRTAIHSAAIGGDVPLMQALIEAGLDITAAQYDRVHVLHIAANNDNFNMLKYLIATNSQLLDQTSEKGWTAVHYAAAGGSVPVMAALIEAGLDITARANDGSHVLHIAARHDNLTIVKYAIETNSQLLQQTENHGWTAVHFAAAGGSVPVMAALKEAGLGITARTNDGSHVLHIAAINDNLPVVKYLTETNPELLQQTENRGWTAVHFAAAGGSVPVMAALIEAGLDITARTNDGSHVLHFAAGNDNLPIVKCLTETNPELLQQTENHGWTAVHSAAARGSVPVMTTLIEAGLDITARTNNGSHVLHIASGNDNLPIVKYLTQTNPEFLQKTENRGWTAVHAAAAGGSLPVIAALIEAGLDITARTNDGCHVLHIAARNENLKTVKYLIETNPELLQQTENRGSTAVHFAAGGGSVPVMAALIEAGLDITARTNDGCHVLHIAASNDNLTVVKYLIEANPELLQQTENHGWTAVHSAAAGGSVPVIAALIEAGLDITARTNDGCHVLHIAARNENLKTVKYLIETNPELLHQTENRGSTAVHFAAAGGSVPMMAALIEAGLDITARTNDGCHVLHIAAMNENPKTVKYLIETNPELLQQTENRGWTAVHFAAAGGSVPVMEALIEAGLDITARTNDGYHVLHIATNNDNLPIVKYLIETNPELLQQVENRLRTAVHSAAAGGSVPVMAALIEAGLDITARTNDGSHVLHFAAGNDNLPIVKYLTETNPELLYQTENRGWTAVHFAAGGGSVPVMAALIGAGLDITARTNDGSHVLHIASGNDNLPVVKYLTETNSELLQQTENRGWTAVHFAAGGGSVPVIVALIEAGLDITARTNDGSHILHIASGNDNLPIVKYLTETNPELLQKTENRGWTAVHFAAAGGSVPVIVVLIEAGLDITARTSDGCHVLHVAAKNENLKTVKYLIETNPELLRQTENRGWTAVHFAAAGGSVPVIAALIEAGLDITARTNNGSHVVHIASGNDNLPVVKYLTETNPELLQKTENRGWTAVHSAAAGGSVPVMAALIEAGLDITARTSDGCHVLHVATRNENLKTVKYLIETNPELLQQTENRGWTAMHFAAAGGSVPVMVALIEAGLDITARANDGSHILHIASGNDNLPIVKYLIETNPELLQQTENRGWTAVHFAAGGGSVPVIAALIEAGLDIRARTNNGCHVLHIASGNDNLPIVKYLIETNPELLQQTGNHGWTAVHSAAASGSVPVIVALIEAGLDITARTNDGCHVLHVATRNENLKTVKYLIETNPEFLRQTENRGWTAVHFVAAGGSVSVMAALIEAGLDITARANDGSHILHIASSNDNLPIVKYLIETNPELLQQNENRGWTALHFAAAGGSVSVMAALIEAGLDVTARASDGSHILHIASGNDNLPIVKYLIETNPELLQQTENCGWTAVHSAASGGSLLVIAALTEAGLDITARTNDGCHVLHIAARNENLKTVKYLIETNPELLQQTENRGSTAVHFAAAGGSVPVMAALIEAGLDITARTNAGCHVLHIAAISNNLPIVKYLIETNPELLQQTENRGWTAVHSAASGGSVPVIVALIEAGLDITARTSDGCHVLHIASRNENLKTVKYLIETNPELLHQTENRGSTAVHFAAGGGSVPVMAALIEAGLDITARTNDSYHVLHIAVINNNLPIVKYLIETNPELLQQTDNRGWTAVHSAASGGSVPVMAALIEAGLDITARTNDGCNVLHIASRNDNLKTVKYLIESNPELLHQTENRGSTAVHFAAAGGSVPVMAALIEAGLDITARTNAGCHVLHIAAMNENPKTVKCLIETNPELLQQTENRGWTAVHFAASGGSVPVMAALKEAGLNITARTNDGCHVLHIAAMNNNLRIVKYLIETNPELLQQTENHGWTAVHFARGRGNVPVMAALIEAGLGITVRTNFGDL